jgi:hypothetical protein
MLDVPRVRLSKEAGWRMTLFLCPVPLFIPIAMKIFVQINKRLHYRTNAT